ncbi:7 transmembrane receptor [Paragonimus heterotremus]|uniref:7 transmembrane receptor n=1 Tax=Paragonimus heterotremus TaxID=100268 RepID=A0A8J4SQB7_9TREM|nr:7 transmembrane receptor [Paragonimus heterotremus]
MICTAFIIATFPIAVFGTQKVIRSNNSNATVDEKEVENLRALYDIVLLVCTQILNPIICIIGISTNLINMIVLAKPRMRSSTNMYLLALAVFDFFYGCMMILSSLRAYNPFQESYIYSCMFPYLVSVVDLCSHTASWLTCAFTVERYIAITYPILARKICTAKRCKSIICMLCVFNLCIILPSTQSRIIVPKTEVSLGRSEDLLSVPTNVTNIDNIPTHQKPRLYYSYEYTDFGKWLTRVGWPMILSTLVVILPLLLLTVFNGLLIRSVIRTSLLRKHLRPNPVHIVPECHGMTIRLNPTNEDDVITDKVVNKTSVCSMPDEWRTCPKESNSSCPTANPAYESTTHVDNLVQDSNIQRNSMQRSNGNRVWERQSVPYGQCRTVTNCRRIDCGRLSEKNRITVMLILVVLAFIVFTLPSAILLLARELLFINRDPQVDLKWKIAGNFINLGISINSTLNFFLYSWLSRRFRRTFYSLILCD